MPRMLDNWTREDWNLDNQVKVKFRRLHTHAELPSYATSGSAGMDVYLPCDYPPLSAGEIRVVPCGFAVELPPNFELQVRSRSGLSSKGLVVNNAPGTIDSDYRGEVGVILYNQSPGIFPLNRGDRIAQMVLCRVPKCEWEIVDELGATERGEGGYGHTGT